MLAYSFSPEEKTYLFELGKRRNAAKKPEWTRRKMNHFDDKQIDCLGILGKAAAAALFGSPLDDSITVHGDRGYDLRLSDGRTVAVKLNHRWGGYLLVEGRDKDTPTYLDDLRADVIVGICYICDPPRECFCHSELLDPNQFSTVYFSGWLSSQDFIKKKKTTNWGIGVRHYVHISELQSIQTLMYN